MTTISSKKRVSVRNFTAEKWLETVPHGYLKGMIYGHSPQYSVPDYLMEEGKLRQVCLYDLAIFASAEKIAVTTAAGLTSVADDDWSRIFLATQTFDEARHYEIFVERIREMGLSDEQIAHLIEEVASPEYREFQKIMLQQVDNKDLLGGLVTLNIILEGMAFPLYGYEARFWKPFDPGLTEIIIGAFKDETRHVGFAEKKLAECILQRPEEKARLSRLATECSIQMEKAFESFLNEFVGLYQDACQEHKEKVGDAEIAPGMRMIDTPVVDQVNMLLRDIVGGHRERLEKIGLEYLN